MQTYTCKQIFTRPINNINTIYLHSALPHHQRHAQSTVQNKITAGLKSKELIVHTHTCVKIDVNIQM